MKLNKFFIATALSALVLPACNDEEVIDPYAEAPEPPVISIVPPEPIDKPKAMWIDAHANLTTLNTKAGIDAQLEKIKTYGMNLIYLDVKPGLGYALYDSDILPHLDSWANVIAEKDFDYLGYFLEKCEEMEIDVVASCGALGFGDITNRCGFVYDNLEKWGPLCQVRMEKNNPNQLVYMHEETGKDGAFLDPAQPEVQDLVVSIYAEIVRKYPKLKGVSLDYLRYYNNTDGDYGFSDFDMNSYAAYWGETVPNRNEIITATGGPGPKFAKFIEWRSMQVTNLMQRIHDTVKAINPDIEIHLWASADWATRYTVGQNWGSQRYVPRSGFQYTSTYSKTGFAHLLDVFVLGAYTEHVWKKEYPNSVWTVENFCDTWNNFIMGDCKCYGSLAIYGLKAEQVPDATYLCLAKTDGYMAFELSHTNNGNKWFAIQEGINRYEKK